MIVNGYAFRRMGDGVCVRNLEGAECHTTLLTKDGEVLETDMYDIELKIARGYYLKNRRYLEESVYA